MKVSDMWRVLIADDEPKIRRGLRSFIDWHEFDMEVVDEAEDGQMAYEKALALHPDLMLVDICMPFMNGLELMQKIRDALPDCILIVISGHDEFDYARQAVRLQAFDFLLKPVTSEQMRATLDKVRQSLTAASCRSQYLVWARQQFDKNLPYLREKFLRDWIGNRLSWLEAREHLDFLQLTVPENPGLMVVKAVEKLNKDDMGSERDRHILMLAVQNLIQLELSTAGPVTLFQDAKDQLVGLLPIVSQSDWATLPERLQQKAEQCLGQNLVIARMPIARIETDLPSAYETLCDQISQATGLTPAVLQAKKFIDTNHGRPELTLLDVANSIPVSPSYLSRLLKQELGVSFIEYLTQVRIRMATQLMNDPALKIYEVAERVGYSSQHYFSTAFKKMLDMSPAEYRKGGRSNPARTDMTEGSGK